MGKGLTCKDCKHNKWLDEIVGRCMQFEYGFLFHRHTHPVCEYFKQRGKEINERQNRMIDLHGKYKRRIKMKAATKNKLKEAMEYCDENDKSTEFMIQYMMDIANVSRDCVMNYLYNYANFRIEGD